jgi:hypothetical protein
VGLFFANWRGDCAERCSMPASADHGIGCRLLQHAIEEARSLGAKSLFLGSNTRLKISRPGYQRSMYRPWCLLVNLINSTPWSSTNAKLWLEFPMLNSKSLRGGGHFIRIDKPVELAERIAASIGAMN